MSILVVSVLPAPLSPLTRIAWLPWSLINALKFLHYWHKEERRSASLQPMNRIVSTEIMDQNTQTCSRRLRSRRDTGWAPQSWRPCTAPSCARRTGEAAAGKGSPRSRCSRCTSVRSTRVRFVSCSGMEALSSSGQGQNQASVPSLKQYNYSLRVTKSDSYLTRFLVNSIHLYDSKSIYYENIFHN